MNKVLASVLLIILILSVSLTAFAQADLNNIKAKVITNSGIEEVKQQDKPTKKVQKLTVRILEGEYEGEEYDMSYVISEDTNGVVSNIELKEDDNILVKIEETQGEVKSVSYVRMINQNSIRYISLVILVALILIIFSRNAVKPLMIYMLSIVLISYSLIFIIQNGWNLILVASIVSLIVTILVSIKINGINKRTIGLIVCGLLCIIISYITIDILLNIVNVTNINIKIFKNFISIKDLICSANILLGAGFTNIIMIIALNEYNVINKSYKTKSDNIIEGQRSLKL